MPIQRILSPLRGTLGHGFVDLECVFTLGATGTVTAVKGTGFSTSDWTRNALGTFTIQLPGTGTLSVFDVSASITDDATLDLVPVIRAVSESARTVKVETWKLIATPAADDPTAGAKLRLHVRLKESSV